MLMLEGKVKKTNMSLLKFLQFQPIDPDSDRDEISPDHQIRQEINLNEDLDGDSLNASWDKIVRDMHEDPGSSNSANK